MSITEISEPNRQWGICGFCSSLAAMYANRVDMAKRIQGAITSNQFRTRLLAEVKAFLQLLRTSGKNYLVQELITFNKRWSPGFDYLAYIARVDKIVSTNAFSAAPEYTLAMTPDALVYYLKEICDFKRVRWLPSDMGGEGILGLCKPGSSPLLERLDHWVYRDAQGVIYNWGRVQTNFAGLLVDKGWRVGVHVLID